LGKQDQIWAKIFLQPRKAFLLVLLSVSVCKRLGTSLYFISINFDTDVEGTLYHQQFCQNVISKRWQAKTPRKMKNKGWKHKPCKKNLNWTKAIESWKDKKLRYRQTSINRLLLAKSF